MFHHFLRRGSQLSEVATHNRSRSIVTVSTVDEGVPLTQNLPGALETVSGMNVHYMEFDAILVTDSTLLRNGYAPTILAISVQAQDSLHHTGRT